MNKESCDLQIKKYQSLVGSTFKHRQTEVTIVINSLICRPKMLDNKNDNEYDLYANYYSSASFRRNLTITDRLSDVFRESNPRLNSL